MDNQPQNIRGRIIGDYTVIDKLGEGTFGETYLVEHKDSRKRYALKIQRKQEIQFMGQARDAAQQERDTLEMMRHPFIISYVDSFILPDDDYRLMHIVMEYADGQDIYSKMSENKKVYPEQICLNWFTQICLGIAHLHQQNIIHRDIKPQNIFLVGDSIVGGIAKIGDFGCCRIVDLDSKAPMTMQQGTLMYFSPERCLGRYTLKADIWALGVVLYEMLTGIQLFSDSSNLKEFDERQQNIPPLPDRLSHSTKSLVQDMLKFNPDNRPTIVEILKRAVIQDIIKTICQRLCFGIEIGNQIGSQVNGYGITIEYIGDAQAQKLISPVKVKNNQA